MNLDQKIALRSKLLIKLRKKKEKIRKIAHVYYRNCYEATTMIKEHNSLDRDIFEETVGITKCKSPERERKRLANAAVLTDAFIESLSEENKQKLIERLIRKRDADKIENLEKGLKQQ